MKPLPLWLAGVGSLLGTDLVTATADGDPNWWRLAVNASNVAGWSFCNLRLYADRECQRALSASITQRRSVSGAASVVGAAGTAIGSWSYNCASGSCQPMEAWLALGFSQPVVVQCLRYEACASITEAATTTTTRRTPPAPTTTTTPGTTTTEFNPFLDLDFGGGRRLANPDQVVLHRSADTVTWTLVAAWNGPQPGAVVSLDSSVYAAPYTPLVPTTWQPSPDGCSLCGLAGRGISKQATLEADFGRKVYLGTGMIEITRGDFSTLTMQASSSPWFQASGNQLQVLPQDSLAPSGGCVRIKLFGDSVLDADGYAYEPDPLAPYAFESCVEDYEVPQLRSSDPPNQATGVELLPTLQLNFNEEVRLADPTTAAATLSARGPPASGGSIPPPQIIDLAPAMLRIWDPNTGASVLDVRPLSELEAQTSYELEIRSDVVEDVSGNAWQGGTILFTTQCSIYGCVDATTAPPATEGTPPPDENPSIAVYLIVVATLTILCAFGVGVFQLYLRKQFFASKSEVRPFQPEENLEGGTPNPRSPFSGGAPKIAPALTVEEGPAVHWQNPAGPFFDAAGTSKSAAPERPQAHWRGKAREAEDINGGPKRSSADFGAHGPGQAQTDESATSPGGKSDGPGFGRKEKAPPSAGQFNSRERHRSSSGAHPQPPKKEPDPPKPLSDNPEVAAILVELNAQLEKTRKEDLASRKKTFKFSCLKWHPDKNPDSEEIANEVFQWLQSQRDWYLKE